MKKTKFFIFFNIIIIINIFAEENKIIYPYEIKSSSYLIENTNFIFHPYNLYDTNTKTVYAESVLGDGIGTKIEFLFEDIINLKAIEIFNGFQMTDNGFNENNRVKSIKILSFNNDKINQNIEFQLSDIKEKQILNIKENLIGNKIIIEILSVYKGSKYDDTCISEITLLGLSKNDNIYKKKNYTINSNEIKEVFNYLNNKRYSANIGYCSSPRLSLEIKNNKMRFISGTDTPENYDNIFEYKYSVENNILTLYPIMNYRKDKGDIKINTEEIAIFEILSKSEESMNIHFLKINSYFSEFFQEGLLYKTTCLNNILVSEFENNRIIFLKAK